MAIVVEKAFSDHGICERKHRDVYIRQWRFIKMILERRR